MLSRRQLCNMSSAKPKTLKVCLLWHSVYSSNMGVRALTYATLRYLSDISEQLRLCFDYTILGYGPTHRHGHIDEIVLGDKHIPFTFKRLSLPTMGVRNVDHLKYFLKWLLLESKLCVKDLSQYDFVLDVSEGDSFADIYGVDRFTRMFLSKMLVLIAKKTFVLLPQTIGPFHHIVSRIMANQLMHRIQHIYPRDQASLCYLKRTFPEREFSEHLDLAFYLPYERHNFPSDKVHVGLNVSALLWQGGYTRDNMFKLRSNYQQLVLDIIHFFLQQKDVVVHLVPHVVSHSKTSQEDDYALSETIHSSIPSTTLAPAFRTPVEAKSYISGLDFFAGARMHSCIAAYSSNVPVVPMAYSRKFSGLFLSSLNYPVLADLQHDSHEQAYQKVCGGFEKRDTLRQAICAQKRTIENRIDAFRNELVAVVKKVYED